jgi:hypothetical protein
MRKRNDILHLPKAIIDRMVECQVEQGNPPNVKIFERKSCTQYEDGGFSWENTTEGLDFWEKIIVFMDFSDFPFKEGEEWPPVLPDN